MFDQAGYAVKRLFFRRFELGVPLLSRYARAGVCAQQPKSVKILRRAIASPAS